VDESTALDEFVARASASLVLYATILGATLVGQAIGIAAEMGTGLRAMWIPAACSVVLEAFAGARAGAARVGRALTARECLWVSATYSIAFVAVTLPLALWTYASARTGGAAWASGAPRPLAYTAIFAGAALAATFVRAVLMLAFSPRRR
jgi:hypothetical protein